MRVVAYRQNRVDLLRTAGHLLLLASCVGFAFLVFVNVVRVLDEQSAAEEFPVNSPEALHFFRTGELPHTPSEARVPNVENLSLDKAKQVLAEKGFELGQVFGAGGVVVAQDQSPGQSLPSGWTINLTTR